MKIRRLIASRAKIIAKVADEIEAETRHNPARRRPVKPPADDDKIKSWLADFDSVIDQVAADPAAIKGDPFLRRIFLLAFPPDLTDELVFKFKEKAPDLEAIKEAHAPYYSAATEAKFKVDPTTGAEEPVSSKLTLKLKNSLGVDAVLRKHGLLRKTVRLTSSPGKRRGQLAALVSSLLELRDHSQLELKQFQDLEQQARSRGDLRAAATYEAHYKRAAALLERVLSERAL